MRMIDRDAGQPCRVIPFERPARREEKLTTTSIAAVIAVTILHREGESPEDRLLDIIDASGEAEILDVADVMEGHETLSASPKSFFQPDNDNDLLKLL